MAGSEPDVTGLLVAWGNGDDAAQSRLIEAVYKELRRLARGYLQWHNRQHFFAIAAHLMSRILVDHARSHHAQKRGAGCRVPLDDRDLAGEPPQVDLLALDVALQRLAGTFPRQSQLVELKFFGGLTFDEIAAVLTVSPITVKRDWALAKAWLYRELQAK
jgi:RNA polymerase sigma-70 factor (ECF subfamily)